MTKAKKVTKQPDKKAMDREKKVERDVFIDDWYEARDYWKRIHPIWDFNYLSYRSISVWNQRLDDDKIRAMGLSVYVPRTYQTVESIHSNISSRTIEFVVKNRYKADEKRSEYLTKMDNAEWIRSGADDIKADILKVTYTFGMAHVLNAFVHDVRKLHFPILEGEFEEKEEAKDPETPAIPEGLPGAGEAGAAIPESEENEIELTAKAINTNDLANLKWEEREVTTSMGMKPKNLNTYYTFPDPHATDQESRRYVYVLTPYHIDKAREIAVGRGWCTEEEAKEKIVEYTWEEFDAVRRAIDWIYSSGYGGRYHRGNHVDEADTKSSDLPQKSQEHMTYFLERYESDYYEVRCGENTKIYSDFNIYPHKQIPIVTFYDVKLPHEDRGMGEPELIRYQQVEENMIHDLTLKVLLIAVAQRYAINSDYVEDETDFYTNDPFRPIRMKAGLGVPINAAFVPLAQPDVKQSPFQLMNLVRETCQATTGASDFLVSANESQANTATESNNLMAATTGRMKEKFESYARSLKKMVNQWHYCYPLFYSESLEMRLTGSDDHFIYLPYVREQAEKNGPLMDEAAAKLNAIGSTLTEIYKNAGYTDVVYASDALGEFDSDAIIGDSEAEASKVLREAGEAMKLMTEANTANANAGKPERFDIFKLAKDVARKFPMISNVEDYIIGGEQQGASLDSMAKGAAAMNAPKPQMAPGAPVQPGMVAAPAAAITPAPMAPTGLGGAQPGPGGQPVPQA